MLNMPLDAIPDLSDTQVIVYSRWDRSPDIMEDQVTYPIVSAMLGAPKVQSGARLFGFRLLVRLHHLRRRHRHLLGALADARVSVGSAAAAAAGSEDGDRTGCDRRRLGLPVRAGRYQRASTDLAELRSFQDWFLRYQLQSVPGVAEVAPLGGFVRQYQVNVDPDKLQAYNIPISRVVEAVRGGNNDVGGRLVEMSGAEYMVRGRGYAQVDRRHRQHRAERIGAGGVPIRVKDVGDVVLGPGSAARHCGLERDRATRCRASSSCARARMRWT